PSHHAGGAVAAWVRDLDTPLPHLPPALAERLEQVGPREPLSPHRPPAPPPAAPCPPRCPASTPRCPTCHRPSPSGWSRSARPSPSATSSTPKLASRYSVPWQIHSRVFGSYRFSQRIQATKANDRRSAWWEARWTSSSS